MRKKHLCIAVMSVCLLVMSAGCKEKAPILIGFSGELTHSLGYGAVAARDGAQLAVDAINQQGGIHGRQLKLLIKDDKRDPETARQVDAELVKEGVVAIIGHISSSQTAAALKQMNDAKTVLISPVSASSAFSRQRDYFFRVVPSSDLLSGALAYHLYHNRHIRRVSGVYDLSNRAFTETFWHAFQAAFRQFGGETGGGIAFQHEDTDLKNLASQITITRPEALLLIASPEDTAMIAQYCRLHDGHIPLFASSWAQSPSLIEKGGQAVEGLEFVAGYDSQNSSLAFQQFARQFEARFHRKPHFAAVFAYEAIQVLAQAVQDTDGESTGLPEALQAIKHLPGVQGVFSLDEYGDVKRDVYIIQVNEGQFRRVTTISPER